MGNKKNPPKPLLEHPPAIPAWKSYSGWGILIWMAVVFISFDKKYSVATRIAFDFLGGLFEFSISTLVPVLLFDLKVVSIFLLFLMAVFSSGLTLLKKQTSLVLSQSEEILISFGLGFVFVSLCVTAMGFLGFLSKTHLYTLLGGLSLLGIGFNLARFQDYGATLKQAKWIDWVWPWQKLLLLLLLLLPFIMSFVPESFYDSLVYHVGVPQLYVNEGRFVDTPHVYFSRFPLFLHTLYVLALQLEGGSLAKLINWSSLVLGVGALLLIGRRLGGKEIGIWAALFVLSIPVIQSNNWSTAVDSAMGGFFLLGILIFLMLAQTNTSSLFWVFCAGLFGGAAFGIKYTGVVVVFALSGTLLFLLRRSFSRLLPSLLVFGAGVFLVMSPWLIRNKIWTGNPVYPIMSRYFESRNMDPKVENEKGMVNGFTPTKVTEFLSLPWIMTMRELSNFNFVGPLTLALLPVLILLPWTKERNLWMCGVSLVLYFGLALVFTRQIRYLLPGFYVLGCLLGWGVEEVKKTSKASGVIFSGVLGLGLVYHLFWILQFLQGSYRPAAVIVGNETRANYSSHYHNGLNPWPWDAIKPSLEKLPPESRIYLLGDEKAFGMPRRFWYSTVHDSTPLVLWANGSPTSTEFYAKLKSEKFTHLLLNWPEANRLTSYHLFEWSEGGRKNFVEFSLNHLRLVEVKPVDQAQYALFLFEIVEERKPQEPVFDWEKNFGKVLNLSK